MSGLYEKYETNAEMERNGIYLKVGTTEDFKDITIKVARAGGANTKFTKLLEQKLRPYRRQIQLEIAEEKLLEKVFIEVWAETVVLGWENVLTRDGKTEIPFTKENCIKLFRELPDLFTEVREMSSKAALFHNEIREEDAKN